MENFIEESNRQYYFKKIDIPFDTTIKTIKLRGKNGKIFLSTSKNLSSVKLEIKYMNIFRDAEINPLVENNVLTLDYDGQNFSDLEITMILPNKIYKEISVFNENANVELRNICSETINIETSNASINMEESICNNCSILTSNGKVNVHISDFIETITNFIIKTSNGSVDVRIPKNKVDNYILDIQNDTPYNNFNFNSNFKLIEENTDETRTFKTENYSDAERHLFKIQTTNGFIFVNI